MVIILVLLITETRITSFGLRLLRVRVYLFERVGCYTVGFKLPKGADIKCFVIISRLSLQQQQKNSHSNNLTQI